MKKVNIWELIENKVRALWTYSYIAKKICGGWKEDRKYCNRYYVVVKHRVPGCRDSYQLIEYNVYYDGYAKRNRIVFKRDKFIYTDFNSGRIV